MRAVLLLWAGLLLPAVGVSAQEESNHGLRDQRVTNLIRTALQSPDAPESWAGLAQGLSILGSEDVPGLSGLDAAVRIADSLAFSPLLMRDESSSEEGTQAGDSHSSLLGGLVSALSFLGLLMGGWMVSEKLWHLLDLGRKAREFASLIRRVSQVARGVRRIPAPAPIAQQGPRDLALALADHGLPPAEIARQTGLAQDELAVVLALRSRSGAFGRRDLSSRPRSA